MSHILSFLYKTCFKFLQFGTLNSMILLEMPAYRPSAICIYPEIHTSRRHSFTRARSYVLKQLILLVSAFVIPNQAMLDFVDYSSHCGGKCGGHFGKMSHSCSSAKTCPAQIGIDGMSNIILHWVN